MLGRPGLLLLLAALASVAIASSVLWDRSGLPLLRKLDGDVARQEAANASLRDENGRISRLVNRLSGPGDAPALEKAARERLGYVRPDEVLFKFE